MRHLSKIFLISVILFISVPSWACRFWVAVGQKVPTKMIVDDLLEEPYSLYKLADEYPDGWSIGYYNHDEEIFVRGSEAANYDQSFVDAVRFVAGKEPQIVLSHLRRASSGCVGDVPNPHPFKRVVNGQTWVFGHNGGMKKEILIDLLVQRILINRKFIFSTKHHISLIQNENRPQ